MSIFPPPRQKTLLVPCLRAAVMLRVSPGQAGGPPYSRTSSCIPREVSDRPVGAIEAALRSLEASRHDPATLTVNWTGRAQEKLARMHHREVSPKTGEIPNTPGNWGSLSYTLES